MLLSAKGEGGHASLQGTLLSPASLLWVILVCSLPVPTHFFPSLIEGPFLGFSKREKLAAKVGSWVGMAGLRIQFQKPSWNWPKSWQRCGKGRCGGLRDVQNLTTIGLARVFSVCRMNDQASRNSGCVFDVYERVLHFFTQSPQWQ